VRVPTSVDPWLVDQTSFDRGSLHHDETVLTIGNGYFCSRGTFEEPYPGEWRTTFLHGVFDAVPIAFTEIANMPDWTAVQVRVDGHAFDMRGAGAGAEGSVVTDYRRILDLRTGRLSRSLTWTSPTGVVATLQFSRFASLADEHLGVVTVRVTPDRPCTVQIGVPVASPAGNLNDGRYHIRHTVHERQVGSGDVAGVQVSTQDGCYEVAMACRVTPVGEPTSTARWELPEALSLVTDFAPEAGQTVGVDKVAAYQTSRDGTVGDEVADTAVRRVQEAADVASLSRASDERWAQDWQRCGVEIDGDDEVLRAVRFTIFHLLIAGPRTDDDVNIGAKTLSGFGYRGHAFWDTEIFMLPMFIHTLPEVARNLLDYRWHRLVAARRKAASQGFEGAQFPWESADTGEEVTPAFMPAWGDPNTLVRVWTGDIEIHISADIAYGALQYLHVTGDEEWFAARGAELVLDVARFYASRAEEDDDGTFHYRDVIGPDEYHEHVDDNAFTNAMARWSIRSALSTLEWLERERPERAAQLRADLDLSRERLTWWRTVADGIVVPVLPDGLIPQFEGYLDLIDVDLDDYEPRTRSMHEILGLEGANEHQVVKQPDVLMLTLLLEDEFSDEQRRVNYDYYTPRTDHTYGSSLGPAMQAIIAARDGLPDDAMEHFRRAAFSDLGDVRGNADSGIHAASCGGVWQAVVLGFGGLKIADDGTFTTHPALPRAWRRLAFTVTVRGEQHRIEIHNEEAAMADGEIKAFIFDLDGVITDTAEYHYRAWKRMADEEGIPMDQALGDELRGVARRPALERIVAGASRPYSEEEMLELMDRKNGYYVAMLDDVTPDDLLPGVAPLLDELRAAGLKVAIGSASKNATKVLDHLGVADRFDAVSDGYSVKAHKPEPDLFLHAAAQLGVSPSEAVVVEDAAAGVEAALAGGFHTIGIGPADRVGEAELVLDGFADVTLAELLARLRP
jgi:kojibiose phosphorylase